MNYIRLWQQTKNSLIFNKDIDLMKQIEQNNCISFVRAKIKSWDELVNLYGLDYDCTSICIREDGIYFSQNMEKFCGEEFEIAINLNDKIIFRIADGYKNWIITRHMVDIIESENFEINKNWPITKIAANDNIERIWRDLYYNCNKIDRKILNKVVKTINESVIKRVRVKSWEELVAKYEIVSDGILIKKENISFHNDMRQLCGREFIAEYQDNSYDIGRLWAGSRYWTITRGMVAEI